MLLARAISVVALMLIPAIAASQTQLPTALLTRGRNMTAICQSEGGRVVNGAEPFIYNQLDLTGDGRPEFVMNEANFVCTNKDALPAGPNGSRVEVYDGVTGASIFAAEAYRISFNTSPRPQLVLTLRGPICGPNLPESTTCARPLTWNPTSRTFAGMPTLSAQAARPQPAPSRPGGGPVDPLAGLPAPKAAPTPAQAAAPAPKGGAMTLADTDKTAVFKAAGFKQTKRGWERCEDPGTLSYEAGAIAEVLDLNADGRPEAVVTEGSTYCFGNTEMGFSIMTKGANGAWTSVMDTQGVFVVMKTRANGWLEVEAGGPGFEQPIYRFNGKQYVYNRTIKE